MLTEVDRRLQGTCWSALICFCRDIFEPCMPPYMSLCFGIVERRCDHIAIKGLSVAGAFFFFISSFLHFFFHFLFFLRLFLPLFPLS